MNSRPVFFVLVALVVLLVSALDASACAVCFGSSDSKLAQGMNAGIFTLLGVVGGVLFGIAGFFFYIVRRAAANPLPIPAEPLSSAETLNV